MTSPRKLSSLSDSSAKSNSANKQRNSKLYGTISIDIYDDDVIDVVSDGDLMEAKKNTSSEGSNWIGAAFNLTSSTVGAGCIGLGGAIANSGGLVSIAAILTFAVLSKYSFDLVVSLGLQTATSSSGNIQQESSYENLGYVTYGRIGKFVVIISKGLYSFGCNVAYIKIIQDNFSIAASQLLYGDEDQQRSDGATGFVRSMIQDSNISTIILCTTIMFPLCLLRDLTPLERVSMLKVIAVMSIVIIVMYLFFVLDDESKGGAASSSSPQSDFVDHWLRIQDGVWESLGTFVFTFVSQHTVHLVFQSLKPSERNLAYFGQTTTLAVIMATTISLFLGLVVYMTYWENTSSDIFELYPSSGAIEFCRVLLCTSMLLTYPFPLITVRELLVLVLFNKQPQQSVPSSKQEEDTDDDVPLIQNDDRNMDRRSSFSSSWLVSGSETQLKGLYHVAITSMLLLTSLILALKASSLGVVLNLIGCAFGTVISYILPALFSYKLRGHTILGSLLFLLGGSVGLIGTYYSIVALF